MKNKIDISEDEILKNYTKVLDILLLDHSTKKNIIWGTKNYEHLGNGYFHNEEITTEKITGINGNLIMPRVSKNENLQQLRIKNMAEVFTPSWVCNIQNNIIDNSWFERKNVFNKESFNKKNWTTNRNKIKFPKNKNWKDYINEKRFEIACGEAPYLVSRYDSTAGQFIEIENRIGLLDRKLRVINENVNTSDDWINVTKLAYKNIYGYEWQGDSLLLAREAMLFTFIENYNYKFKKEPSLKSIQDISNIISWNLWQMDGLNGVVPYSNKEIKRKKVNLFGEEEIYKTKHNGIYCIIKNWSKKDDKTGKNGKKIKYVDLIKRKYV